MAACYYRDSSWKEDTRLADEMRKYVQQGLTRQEMMSFSTRNFSQYTRSIRTLDRRLRHFSIFYTDKTVSLNEVREAVAKELNFKPKCDSVCPKVKLL